MRYTSQTASTHVGVRAVLSKSRREDALYTIPYSRKEEVPAYQALYFVALAPSG